MSLHHFLILAGVATALPLHAASVAHYWDFDTLEGDVPIDVVGEVATSAVGTPEVSTHATYGEAYAGSGMSLNSSLGMPDYLLADVHDGAEASAMIFGAGSFSYSYWSWDASDLDGDARGPRVFDCLNLTDIGIQLATNLSGVFNYRMDDDSGVEVISNNILGGITQDDARWVHVAVNVDRDSNAAEIFFDAVSQGSYDISTLIGDIEPCQDMQIGVINGGTTVGTAQQCGLDDLAFYTGLLTATDIAGLAAATLTPNDINGAPEAPFEITQVSRDSVGLVTLTWNSTPLAIYAVDVYTEDRPLWLEILDDHPSGGAETSFQHSAGTERAMYRIRIPD